MPAYAGSKPGGGRRGFGDLVSNAPKPSKWVKFNGTGWVQVGSSGYTSARARGLKLVGKNTSRYMPYTAKEQAYHRQLAKITSNAQGDSAQHGSPGGIRGGGGGGNGGGGTHGSPQGIQRTGRGQYHPPGQKGGNTGPNRNPKGPPAKRPPKTPQSQNFNKLGKSIGNPNTGQMYDVNMADALAGNQFDPQIHDLKALIARLPAQTAQNQADIQNWYGQVSHLNDQAGQRAQDTGNQLGQDQQNVTQSILAALGGGANANAGAVGAQGADESAMLRQMGAISNQYSADMSPFIQMESAGAMKSQIAQDNNQGQDYQLQLADLMGQRGQAKTDAIMKIMDANNALSQQRFGNKLSKLQAQSGIASLMGSLALQGAQTADTRAHTQAMQQQAGGSGSHMIFNQYDPIQRGQIIEAAVGMNANGHPTRTRMQAMSQLKGRGFDPQNPRIQDLLRTYYGH